ncbi:MAG: PAS domain S-box protein, partial [Planctomycetota bacterium]|nr:PAS domain S-box protein [Planctomycetota bacterium]
RRVDKRQASSKEEEFGVVADDFQLAFYNAPIATAIIDIGGGIVNANKRFSALFATPNEDLKARTLYDLIQSDVSDIGRKQFVELICRRRDLLQIEQGFVKRNGELFWGRVKISAVHSEKGRFRYALCTIDDVTKEKKNVEAQILELDGSQKRFNATLRALPDRLFVTDSRGKILDYHCQLDSEFSFEQPQFVGSQLTDSLPPREQEQLLTGIQSVLTKGGTVQFEYDQPYDLPASVYEARIVASSSEEVLVIIRDVTEKRKNQKDLEKANVFLDTLFEHMPHMIFVKEAKDLRFVRWNRAGENVIGHRSEEIIGKNDYDLFPKDQADFFTKADREALAGDGVVDIPEEALKTREGDIRYLHTKKVPIRNVRTNEPEYLLGISEDVTDKIRVKQAMSRLREIHHRVKNNLQVVQSLLSLQSQGEEDPRFIAFLNTARSRVRAMSLIHEQLYQSTTVSRVNFSAYLHQLVPNLVQVYSLGRGKIDLTISGEMDLSLDACVPCGLVVHELVSNSLKHAFPDEQDGKIEIIAKSKGDDQFDLFVGDDGIGLPVGFDFRKTTTLGLQLVIGLLSQMRGSITLQEGPGCRFLISFTD